MNRLLTIAALVMGASTITPAADMPPEMAKVVHEQATSMADAMLAGNTAIVVDRMNPQVIAMMGSRENALKMVEQGLEQMKAQGMSIALYEVSAPSERHEGDEHYVTFLQTKMRLTGPANLESIGFLVASRLKAGGEWSFIDGAGVREASALAQLFPGLPTDLVLPETDQRVVQEE